MLTRDQIEAIIRQVLDLPDSFVLDETVRPAFVPGWDSVGWLNIIAAIEDAQQKEIPFEILDDVSTLGDFFSVLTRV